MFQHQWSRHVMHRACVLKKLSKYIIILGMVAVALTSLALFSLKWSEARHFFFNIDHFLFIILDRLLKNFQFFCPCNIQSYHLVAVRWQQMWSLNDLIYIKQNYQLTKLINYPLNEMQLSIGWECIAWRASKLYDSLGGEQNY